MLTNQLDKVNHLPNVKESLESKVDTIVVDESEIKPKILKSKLFLQSIKILKVIVYQSYV